MKIINGFDARWLLSGVAFFLLPLSWIAVVPNWTLEDHKNAIKRFWQKEVTAPPDFDEGVLSVAWDIGAVVVGREYRTICTKMRQRPTDGQLNAKIL